MKISRIMIAAPKSGSGKTMVTCALLQALKNRGKRVVSFKCGPDYIDPMFHEKVIDVRCGTLDTFFTKDEQTRALFAQHAKHAAGEGYAILEGVMGLYDGLGGIRKEGSSYHLAKVTGTPIVLVADVKGMGYSILPMLAGFLAYDSEHLIKGVILNRISRGYFETIKPLIEDKLQISVPGFLPEKKEFHMESRHLGLVMPDELGDIKEKLLRICEEFERTVSVLSVLEIAKKAEDLSCAVCDRHKFGSKLPNSLSEAVPQAELAVCNEYKFVEDEGVGEGKKPVIAVARDEAFCFYYKENLLLLEENGASIKYFSPLHDTKLPNDCSGLLIGGGYPELYADTLGKNASMRMSIKQAVEKGMPVVAECGGFMYLHSSLTDKAGISYPMVGVISARCFDTGRLVRFGYIEIQEKDSLFLPRGEKIRGHEFHYYDSTNNGDNALAVKPVTGKSYPCIIEGENCWLGFPHLYYPSNPAFAKSFVKKAAGYKCEKDEKIF